MNNEGRHDLDNQDGNEDDYGQEDYDNNQQDEMNNNNEENPAGEGEDADVDQYFDDAGDIGYLPADHVR